MTQLCPTCDSSQLLLFSLLYDNLLSFISFLYSHPLHLAYLLYFSPYILHLFFFLFPLLLSTSIPLLLFLLHSIVEGEAATVILLDQLVSVVVDTIGNVFEWEFETMVVLYKNVGLICEAGQDTAEICVQNYAKTEVLQSPFGTGERINLKGSSFASQMNVSIQKWRTVGEVDRCFNLHCEVREEQLKVPLEKSKESEILEAYLAIDNRKNLKNCSFEPETSSSVPENRNHRKSMGELCEISSLNSVVREGTADLSLKKSERSEILESPSGNGVQINPKGCSFVPQTPERISEILVNPPSVRKAKQTGEALKSLSRSGSVSTGSMRINGEFSSHNCEVVQGPNERFFESSEKIEILKPESEKDGSFKSRNPTVMQENHNNSLSTRIKYQESRANESLQREGSMREEKEWKRTLACKLYEERMTFELREERAMVEGAEEMDLLWEAYEADAGTNKIKNKGMNGKKEAHIEEEEDESVGRLCCLQALKLSTGRINLGVGRPNLVRISKVFKGIGFFHRCRKG